MSITITKMQPRYVIIDVTKGFYIRGDTYYECLSTLDHGVHAADDTTSPLESGLLIYKGTQ